MRRIVNISLLISLFFLSNCKKEKITTNQPITNTAKNSFTQVAISGNRFAPISDHQAFEFDGKIWVVAGRSGALTLNKIWRSDDGINWTHLNSNDTTSNKRFGHQAVVFNNKIFIIGGISASTPLNDVWSSPDGINWTMETSAAEFPYRFGHKAFVFGNKIWVIGGDGGILKNDIWNSTDGKNWTQVTTSGTIFTPRAEHDVVLYNNKLYLSGGYTSSGRSDEVWSSSDGITWILETTNSPKFLPIYGHQTLVYDNKIFLIGGITNNWGPATDEIWTSENGKDWTLNIIEGVTYGKRVSHQAFIFKDKIHILSGSDGSGNEYSDLWVLN